MSWPPTTTFFEHRQTVDQNEMLMHHADADLDGVGWGCQFHLLAPEEYPSAIRPIVAVEAFGQGRLPGAVLAQKAVDLAGLNIKRDPVIRNDMMKGLGQFLGT